MKHAQYRPDTQQLLIFREDHKPPERISVSSRVHAMLELMKIGARDFSEWEVRAR